jgi:hypothetical protein
MECFVVSSENYIVVAVRFPTPNWRRVSVALSLDFVKLPPRDCTPEL